MIQRPDKIKRTRLRPKFETRHKWTQGAKENKHSSPDKIWRLQHKI